MKKIFLFLLPALFVTSVMFAQTYNVPYSDITTLSGAGCTITMEISGTVTHNRQEDGSYTVENHGTITTTITGDCVFGASVTIVSTFSDTNDSSPKIKYSKDFEFTSEQKRQISARVDLITRRY